MRYLALTILFSYSAAAAVITSVTCRAGSQHVEVVAESACAATGEPFGPFGEPTYSRASVSTSLTMPSAIEDLAVATISMYLDIEGIFSTVQASATADYMITSEGPVRPGYLIWDNEYGFGFTRVFADGEQIVWCGNPGADPPYCIPHLQEPRPITLGEPFVFQMDRTAFKRTTYFASTDDASIFRFRLVEADGATPVRMELAPEPGTALMIGLAAALLLGLKRRCAARN